MQAEREKNLNIPIGLHGVRLACMQVHEVARPDSDSAVVKQEIHKATPAEQRDFARGRHGAACGLRRATTALPLRDILPSEGRWVLIGQVDTCGKPKCLGGCEAAGPERCEAPR